MRIATYTRISTDEDRQPFSLGAQAERLEAYARSQDGWRIVRRFTDQASGATLDRPGLRQALSEAAAGVYELLLVYRVDRLSRSVRQLAEIGENLDHFGVSLRSATEPFDTSTAAGKMMLQMLAVFAEFERTTIVERITAGMERAAAEGRWIVGSTPFAYLRDRDNKQIVPDPARVDVVRRIFRMYAEERMGAEAIAQVLNAEGHRSKNGVPFARPNVLWILRNPAYVGKVAFRGRVHPGRHEPLVDERTFEAVQAILAERGESQALKRGHPSDYMLSGVLRCGRCRKAYVGTAAHGRNTRYRYYVCSTRYRYGTKTCDGDRLPMEALEDAVVEQMAKVFGDTALVGKAVAVSRAEEATASDEVARRLASTQQQLAGARRSLDRYFAAFEEGIMSAADCRERVDRLRKRIEALEAEERATADAGPDSLSMAPTVDDVAEWARDLRRLFESATAQQKKAVIRLLVKELRVMSRKDIRPTYKIPALVRAPDSQVVLADRCANRSAVLLCRAFVSRSPLSGVNGRDHRMTGSRGWHPSGTRRAPRTRSRRSHRPEHGSSGRTLGSTSSGPGPRLAVARSTVLRQVEREVDDLLRLCQLLPVRRQLRLGFGHLRVDPGLLALE